MRHAAVPTRCRPRRHCVGKCPFGAGGVQAQQSENSPTTHPTMSSAAPELNLDAVVGFNGACGAAVTANVCFAK